MRWLNYQHLFYFWQVARTGSFTDASNRLRLAQPTLSAQIKTLEAVLGEQLFIRAGRGLQLTATGQVAFRYADQIFSLGQEFLDVLEGRAEGRARALRIGVADVVPKSIAFRIIDPALESSSRYQVTCTEDKTDRLLAALAIGDIDLVIADRPIPVGVKVKAFNHFIGESGVSFLCSRQVSSKIRGRFPQSLLKAPLLLPSHESAMRPELDAWLATAGISPTIIGSFQDRALMKVAARAGRGIIPIPAAVEREVKAEFDLVVVGRTEQIKERFYLISVERKVKDPIIQDMCSAGKQCLSK